MAEHETSNGNGVLSPDAGPSKSPLPDLASPRSSMDDAGRIRQLEDELDTVRGEKENLGNQYRTLLGKLTAMRQSLGDKLREDAVSPQYLWPDGKADTSGRKSLIAEKRTLHN